jgi:hypothetical protein
MLSCGVLVTDGERLLLGRAPLSPRWDFPKGAAPIQYEIMSLIRKEGQTGIKLPCSTVRQAGKLF